MKTIACSIATAALLASAAGVRAGNLYITTDAGGIYQQDATLRQSTTPTYTATFNLGVRGDMAMGYNFNESFATELEIGFLWNSMDKVGGTSLSSIGQSVDLYSVPVLANLIFKVPTKSAWTPYLGVGAGATVGIFEFKDAGQTYADASITPAVQGEAGLKYALNKNASIGIAYKFLGTLDQRYNLRGIDDHVTLDGVYIHGVYATFTLNF